MIDPKDNQDTSFIHRTTEAKPPRNISHYLIGRPLSTADAPHQTIGKAVGLAVFASDALSSTAYATQEIIGHSCSRRYDGIWLCFSNLA